MNKIVVKCTLLFLEVTTAYFFSLNACYESDKFSLPNLGVGEISNHNFYNQESTGSFVQNSAESAKEPQYDIQIGDTTIKELIESSKQVSSDVVGWIYIPDSNINYPILYGKERGKDFYLTHNLDSNEDRKGSIYLDDSFDGALNDISLLNGHSMKDKTMFGELLNYKQQYWADHHKYIFICDGEAVRKYLVFSCVLLNAENEGVQVKFQSMKERLNYFEEIKGRSVITPEEVNNPLDILILNTCSYEADNFRCLIFATAVEENGLPV